jgi:hypothetical protein
MSSAKTNSLACERNRKLLVSAECSELNYLATIHKPKVCFMTFLIQGLAEEDIGPVERYCTAADYRTSCDRPPKNICTGKFPNCQ